MPTPTLTATRKLLTAGQARAQQLINHIEVQCLGQPAVLEIGALRAMVRNLCAEVAGYENDEDTIAVTYDGRPYGVMVTEDGFFEYAQIAGIDVTDLLPIKARQDMTTLALNARREQRIDDAWDARQDRLAQEAA
jgi:hypothetical protein